ncbi:MAG: Rpn family recombination-promoting nuclease/putative transposase [Bacteroidota bacterium]
MGTNSHNPIIHSPGYAISQSHDAYGKDSLNYDEIIVDFFKSRLEPELVARIDFTTLEFIPTEFITGGQLLHSKSDVIFKFSIDNNTDAIYFIIELQSTPDKYIAKRLDRYRVLLLLRHGKKHRTEIMPSVMPICMYNGLMPYPYSTYLGDCAVSPELAKKCGLFNHRFELWDLTQYTIAELLEQGGKSGLFQALLKQGRRGEFIEVLQKVTPEYIQQLPRGHVHSSAIYIYHNSKPEQGEVCLRLLSELIQEKTVKEKVMSYAASIHYKGIEEGKQLGIEEGVTKGKQLGIEEGVTRGKQLGIEEGVTRGKQLGIEEGVTRGMLQAAKNLLRQGVELDTISLATGLQREQLLQLK